MLMSEATPQPIDPKNIPQGGPVRITLLDGNEAYGTVSGIVKKRLPRKVGDAIAMQYIECLEVTHRVNAKADDTDSRRARLVWPLSEIARVETVTPGECQGCG